MRSRSSRIAVLTLAVLAAACSDAPPPSDDTGGPSPAPAAADSGATGSTPPPAGDSAASARGRAGGSPAPVGSVPPPPVDRDTARGLVAVGGSLPMTRVTLRDTVGRIVTITGQHAPALSRLGGLEVWVAGTRSEMELAARVFRVRAVEGVPAIDGQLTERRGGALVLTTAEGRAITLSGPPDALRGYVGRRVWVTRAASGEVMSFGLIEEPEGEA